MSFLKRVPFPVYCLLFILEGIAAACAGAGYGDWPWLAGGALVLCAVLAAISTGPALPRDGAE